MLNVLKIMNDAPTPASAPETPQEIHEALYDGADLPIHYLSGADEVVKVRKIPRNQFGQYAQLIGADDGDEAAECGFYVDSEPGTRNSQPRSAEWARTLDDASFDRLLEEGQRLNFPRFTSWFGRQARKLKLVRDRNGLLAEAQALIENSPHLKTLLAGTNGSSPRDTPTPISGAIRRTN